MSRRVHHRPSLRTARLLLILTLLALAPLTASSDDLSTGLYQEAYVKAPNPGSSTPTSADGDWFGRSVAYANGVLVVGAPHENGGDGGVDGALDDDSLNNAGAAYVYRRTSTGWQYEAFLKAPIPELGELFGFAVATDGSTVVVGATESGAFAQGHAFVFERIGGAWVATATLEASNPGFMDDFGASVAVSGGVIAVGAPGEDGVDDGLGGSGAVYIFERFGGFWLETDLLKAPNAAQGESFGAAVGLSGGLLAAGAPGSDLATGEVHVLDGAGGWTPVALLRASNGDRQDRFGEILAISGTTVVVGVPTESSAPGGDGSDDDSPRSGTAYVFAPAGGAWSQRALLKASNAQNFDTFGASVAVAGDVVVVGATGEDSPATGVNGDQGDVPLVRSSGAAYVFRRGFAGWTQTDYLKASNTGVDDFFGSAVAIWGDSIAVGAFTEDSYSKLIDGDQDADVPEGRDSGAVYVFGGLFDR